MAAKLVHAGGVASLLVFLSSLVPSATGDADGTKKYPQSYYHSFKGNPERRAGFERMGPDAEQCVKFDAAGLRITLPAGFGGERPSTGVAAPFVVKGDFEITIGFEILQEPTQQDTGRVGTRFSLAVFQNTQRANLATLSRSMSAGFGSVFVSWVSLWNEVEGRAVPEGRTHPTTAKSGRLRLVRTGSVLSHYAAEGDQTDFTFLRQTAFGDADLKLIRLTGTTGDARAALDVRVTDIRIQAQALAGTPESSSEPAETAPEKPPAKGRLAIAVIAGVVALAAGAGGVWFYRRRHPPTAEMAEPEPEPAEPEPAAEQRPEPGAAPNTMSVECSGCGKVLKAGARWAGKKVRCPQCKKVLLVPGANAEESSPTS